MALLASPDVGVRGRPLLSTVRLVCVRWQFKIDSGFTSVTRHFETRALPTLPRCYRRSFTFFVTHPIRSIETRSLPALTRSYPRH